LRDFSRAHFAFVSFYEQFVAVWLRSSALIERLERVVDAREASSYERVGPVGFTSRRALQKMERLTFEPVFGTLPAASEK
jgi:hypothetical protein